ncbi:MAG: 50S ribosomal protein L18 [Candidatus Moraniibacteriota bacterium]
MKKQLTTLLRERRHRRVRAKITGTAERPRLVIFRSLQGVSLQVINDVAGTTLVSASYKDIKAKHNTVTEAAQVGTLVAERCTKKGVTVVVFDRGGYQYHGKVKAAADAAREAGLQF